MGQGVRDLDLVFKALSAGPSIYGLSGRTMEVQSDVGKKIEKLVPVIRDLYLV